MRDSLTALVDTCELPRLTATLRSARRSGRHARGGWMRLEVLHVTDCPNLPPMVAVPLTSPWPHGRSVLTLRRQRWENEWVADAAGRRDRSVHIGGSMRLGRVVRLYRDQEGRIVPAPSVDQLHGGLAEAQQTAQSGWPLSPARS